MMQPDDRIPVLIADDHPLFRRGLRDVINESERFRVVEECGNGSRALESIRQQLPRIAALDVDMPGMSGLDVAAALQKEALPTAVIILTGYNDADLFHRAMELDVVGYILKDSAATEILQGLEFIARGEYYISPAMSTQLAKRANSLRSLTDAQAGISRLTGTERRVLHLIAQDWTTERIAGELCVSPRTIEHHRLNICRKLNLSGANVLLRFAMQHRHLL
jgi:DNA-binding NarL/FixJ family response regulator